MATAISGTGSNFTASPSTPQPAASSIDPAVVDQFNTLLDTPTKTGEGLATDEQIATLSPTEVQRIRDRFPDDETAFRKEAYALWQLNQGIRDEIVRQLMQDQFKRDQQRRAEGG